MGLFNAVWGTFLDQTPALGDARELIGTVQSLRERGIFYSLVEGSLKAIPNTPATAPLEAFSRFKTDKGWEAAVTAWIFGKEESAASPDVPRPVMNHVAKVQGVQLNLSDEQQEQLTQVVRDMRNAESPEEVLENYEEAIEEISELDDLSEEERLAVQSQMYHEASSYLKEAGLEEALADNEISNHELQEMDHMKREMEKLAEELGLAPEAVDRDPSSDALAGQKQKSQYAGHAV